MTLTSQALLGYRFSCVSRSSFAFKNVFYAMQEAGLMASVLHPNIVRFMGVTTSPACIVTEYCSRGSLYDVLKAANRSLELAAQLNWPRRLQMVG